MMTADGVDDDDDDDGGGGGDRLVLVVYGVDDDDDEVVPDYDHDRYLPRPPLPSKSIVWRDDCPAGPLSIQKNG